MTVFEFYKQTEKKLESLRCEKSEAKIIFSEFLGINSKDLILNKNEVLNESQEKKIKKVISLREKRIPLQYILGHWDFMGMELYVGEGVLIPREDTQVLVTAVVQKLKNVFDAKIVDLCSGTGCIALLAEKILLKNNPQIYAVEVSPKAFEYLLKNIKKYKSGVIPLNENLLKAYENFQDNSIDAIISNPPYITNFEMKLLSEEVLKEPEIALCGGDDGLYFYKKICELWGRKIKSGGILGFELGINQFFAVREIMVAGGFEFIECAKDINNLERAIVGIKK